ncbi:MAG: LmbE family N-acetylglucosaminyl deacetylase [Cryomorphaceae bacterium]|jgi:LmbE family N-acetylglucosaminyl deacetylase
MRLLLSGLFSLLVFAAQAQFPEKESSSELYHELLKASNTASILYMAAHPDDENTRLISYFENNLHARTAYLSLTRGDGGQNLIGTEIGSAIGILRTQELLAARDIDGGEQFFTRAVDFGYSKSADESFDKWGRENILRDAVWVIRKFRPDVIVTRFPPTNNAGHGHHEASAIVAEEVFDMAADPNAFPEQLEFVDTWQPKRLYFNTSTWWIKDLEEQAQKSDDFITVNVGEYNTLIGESYAQIAARSRSEHKSQGFGSDYPMGNQTEFMEYVLGEKVEKGENLLSNIPTDWKKTEVPQVGRVLEKVINDYDFTNPVASISGIIEALTLLNEAESAPLVDRKIPELENLLVRLAGLEMEATTKEYLVATGSKVSCEVKINLTSDIETQVMKVAGFGFSDTTGGSLKTNDFYYTEAILTIDENADYSNPYWLNAPFESIYEVLGYSDLGKPENDPSLVLKVDLKINNYALSIPLEVVQKEVDPARAVLYSPVYIVPEITAGFDENTIVAAGSEAKEISIKAQSHVGEMVGVLRPTPPKGWTCEPQEVELNFSSASEIKLLTFKIKPEVNPSEGLIGLEFQKDGSQPEKLQSLRVIEYDHIPTQIELSPSNVKIVPVDLNLGGVAKIGYIEGPGDEVAKYLRAVGYDVEIIQEDDMVTGNFDRFDAIVTGIRAYNTREDLAFSKEALNEYVKNGGTWLVQYNTSRRIKVDQIGPYAFELSRERVTDETASPEFLAPDHPVLNIPNEISMTDFDGWVQERGLYFANEWDDNFVPILGWSDPDEPSRNGALIVAPYGDGYFVYSGISFFRELPAGVSGAYRLLSNILALSKSQDGGNE